MAKKENVEATSNLTYNSALTSNISTSQVYTSRAAGTIVAVSGGGGTGNSWTTASTQFNSNNGSAVMTLPHGENTVRIEDTATLDVRGRVKINGEWLDERLERIETMLHIPTRDVTMEEKYLKLKNLWEQYTTALEQYKTWETLKDSK
jgi:hypothetical protein